MKKNKKYDEIDTSIKEKDLYYMQNRSDILEHRLVIGIIAAFILLAVFVVFKVASGSNNEYNIKSDSLNSEYLNPPNNEDTDNEATITEPTVDYSNSIICWGDSFSDNIANSTNFYTYYLSEILSSRGSDITAVYSSGISGDDMLTIAAKQGGVPMQVKPVTIPAQSKAVEISLQSTYGNDLIIQDKLNSGLNPCSIAGIDGNIEYVNGKLSFIRSTPGEAVTLTTPTTVITNSMANIKDYIAVFFFGGEPTDYTPEEVVEIYKAMIDYNNSDRYIIIGSITGDEATLSPYEDALTEEFKNHYINLRKYLTEDVFNDYDISITANDSKALRNGSVPPSFILNGNRMADQGSEIVANILFDRMLQLGIIN